MRESTNRFEQGFTLIETVMFIIIVGIAVSAVTLQFTQNVRHSADPLLRQKGIAIAHTYLDKITSKKWDENTPDGGGPATPGPSAVMGPDAGEATPDLYDDVDDFHNPGGSPDPTFNDYTVAITVTHGTAWQDNPSAPNVTIPGASTKQIVVSVATPIGETLTFTQYRLDF